MRVKLKVEIKLVAKELSYAKEEKNNELELKIEEVGCHFMEEEIQEKRIASLIEK